MPEISLETLRPLLFFGLLVGPTVAWFLYRAAKVQPQRTPEALRDVAVPGEWFCPTCHSLNLPGTNRCYRGCAPSDPPGAPATPVVAPAPMVAVGPGPATAAASPTVPGQVAPLVVSPAPMVAVGPGPRPAAPAGPPVATRPAPSAADRRRTATVDARPTIARRAHTVPVSELVPDATARPSVPRRPATTPAAPPSSPSGEGPGDVAPSAASSSVARPERLGVCPHLGLQLDAKSYFEFASPRHRCFANTPPAKIHLGHQEAHCFGSFRQCPLFGAPPIEATIDQARRAGRPSEASRR